MINMSEDKENLNPQDLGQQASRKLIKNPISLIGIALAVVAFINIVFLFLIDVLSHHPSPYIGILAYMIAPGFLVAGLILIPIGMAVERRRRIKAAKLPIHLPRLPQ